MGIFQLDHVSASLVAYWLGNVLMAADSLIALVFVIHCDTVGSCVGQIWVVFCLVKFVFHRQLDKDRLSIEKQQEHLLLGGYRGHSMVNLLLEGMSTSHCFASVPSPMF